MNNSHQSSVLAVIPARAGSKGLPGKAVALLAGRPLIEHTIHHALSASTLGGICVTTDSPAAADVAQRCGVFVVDRPPALATDTAPIDETVRHAVAAYEAAHPGFRADHVVILYANVPIRAEGIIDAAVNRLIESGADSVRTVAPVGKQHPDWLHKLDGDRMQQFRDNVVHRRQDLEPLYYHDAAVLAVTRTSLFAAPRGPDDHHALFGNDCRAVVQSPDDAADIDTALDLCVAEAILAARGESDGTFEIDGHEIGCAGSVFVIAEAGVNHDGDIDKARRLIDAAMEAGADAVKFQAFKADSLVSRDAAACDYQKQHDGAVNQHEMLKRLELTACDFASLKQYADACGIAFMATPFGIDELTMLCDLGVPAIKISSGDVTNTPLLRAAAQSGLPVIVSTGTANASEVHAVVRLFRECQASQRLSLMHCVSRYPTPLAAVNLAQVGALAARFRRPVGFSDHTQETITGALAVAAGASLLEKHFTLDCDSAGPDHFFSLTPGELTEYINQAKEAALCMSGEPSGMDGQAEVRQLARRSICAATDIPANVRIDAAHLMVRRPGGGIDPIHWDRVIGRITATPVPAGSKVDWAMLSPQAAGNRTTVQAD